MTQTKIEKLVEEYVVELSIDNGGYKPTAMELFEFLTNNKISLKEEAFNYLVEKWCQK